MQRFVVVVALPIAALTATVPLRAQDTVVVRAGSLVRARVGVDSAWHTGRLVAYESDTLRLQRCERCAVEAHPLASVSALEARVRSQPSLGGVLLVMAAGGLAGVIIGDRIGRRTRCHDGPCALGEAYDAALGLGVGVAIGALASTNLRFDVWRPVVVRSPR